jgi:hypothetical protein
MERLLVMRLQAKGCFAQAVLNGIVVGTASPTGGPLCLPGA